MSNTRTYWAVGPEDGEGWQAINAATEAAALRHYARSEYGSDTAPPSIIAQRMPAWDGLKTVSPADWLAAGMGYTCDCGEMAFAEFGGRVIDGQVFCENCIDGMECIQ